jgi:hypothetical protein
MYVAEDHLVSNPLRGRIVRNYLGVVFPVSSFGIFLWGLVVVSAPHHTLTPAGILLDASLTIPISSAIVLIFALSDIWHAPLSVKLEGSTLTYSALRWALIFPKRLSLQLRKEAVSQVGKPRWGGAAPVFGTSEIRDDPQLAGRPFEDYVYLSRPLLDLLGLVPDRRYQPSG